MTVFEMIKRDNGNTQDWHYKKVADMNIDEMTEWYYDCQVEIEIFDFTTRYNYIEPKKETILENLKTWLALDIDETEPFKAYLKHIGVLVRDEKAYERRARAAKMEVENGNMSESVFEVIAGRGYSNKSIVNAVNDSLITSAVANRIFAAAKNKNF